MNEPRYLAHHGIKGQKWGVRRYQNEDGTLTKEGKERYQNEDGTLTKEGKERYDQHVEKLKKIVDAFDNLEKSANDPKMTKTDFNKMYKDFIQLTKDQYGNDSNKLQLDRKKMDDGLTYNVVSIYDKNLDGYVEVFGKGVKK